MDALFNTPWKITNQIFRLFCTPFVWLTFKINGIPWPAKAKFFGLPVIQKHRYSSILIGPNADFRSTPQANPLGANHPVVLCTWVSGASITIGENFGMTGGCIVAAKRVVIGNNVGLGGNSSVIDTDFHPLNLAERRRAPNDGHAKDIVIEDDVFIGMNCIILKGVTIGKGSVIGAGSVVSKSIPPGVIAAGNPAQVIRKLDE